MLNLFLVMGALALQAAPAVSGSEPQASTARPGEIAKTNAFAIIAACGTRKFETQVDSNNNGKVRKAKILLCAKPSESDEQWIATLEKAALHVVTSTALSIEAKATIAGELQAEIKRLRGS